VFEGDCIIGHEASGIVLQCGEGVSHLKTGRSSFV
jgi:L-iditol 2-dehydrogenase